MSDKTLVYKMFGNGDRLRFPGPVENEIFLAPGDLMEAYVRRRSNYESCFDNMKTTEYTPIIENRKEHTNE